MILHKYKHEFVYINNLNILWLLYVYIIMLQKCNQQIEHLDAFLNKDMGRFVLFKDFMVKDYRKKNYLIFYYDHEDQG
jgi:hypothetical protein